MLRKLLMALLIMSVQSTYAQKEKKDDKPQPVWSEGTFSGLTFRSVGPAIASGRIADFSVNEKNPKEYYVAVASGGVWKTVNTGITYEPVFEKEGSYSIGCVEMDPNNSHVVWVGTGENNNQRSVAYGDGVYKSIDGGKTWKNMGLKNSEHIGMIAIDPENSDVVYVAAYGPLWSSGGDRGIYKTTDGGLSWNRVLHVSDHTGFNEVHIDPRDSKVIYACAHQRQRKVYAYVSGGPESNIYKSTDGGRTWNILSAGLPDGDKGRIGMDISPVNPDYIYIILEAGEKKSGVYRSVNRGASFEKMSDNSSSGNYYQEIFCDPKDVNKVFYMDFWIMLSPDGGKTFKKIGEKYKHVDNHALWIDPDDTNHLLSGCDGGIYETYDFGQNWEFKDNLPVTQFYKVAVDNAEPFYNIYGGTQDNHTIGGPSRTISGNGITNGDWFFALEGDGFEPQADPVDPNIVYTQYQYGGLSRFDKKSGQVIDIRPVEGENDSAYRWNWDSPLLISSHNHTRLYYGANKLFRSDDRGESWTVISGDLSAKIDRNKLPLMGRIWSVDAVAKNASTDIFGQLVSIAESYFDENHLVVGTDDGLIHVTTDGGKSWQRAAKFPGVPEQTYVNHIIASQHDRNVFYAAFNHHRYGDFKPYLHKSMDGGKTWNSISGNLPARGSVYSIAEDHVNKDLLFAGTEFGVFFTVDGGKNWTKLKGGLPTIAVRDLAIQKKENDLVLATFGRGFYILDDYSVLRSLNPSELNKPALLFAEKEPLLFVESRSYGAPLKGFMGESFYATENPVIGAVFTYYLKDDVKTLRDKRREAEKKMMEKNENIYYPSLDSLRMEDLQPEPYLLFTVKNEKGDVMRRMNAPAKKGLKRIVWNFRQPSPGAVTFAQKDPLNPYDQPETGYLVTPGNYTVSLSLFEDGKLSELVSSVPFQVKLLNNATLPASDLKALEAFAEKTADIRRKASSIESYRKELVNKVKYIKTALLDAKGAVETEISKVTEVEQKLVMLDHRMNGDASLAKREFETAPSIAGRIGAIQGSLWNATAAPTKTQIQSYEVAARQLDVISNELISIDSDIKAIEKVLDNKKAPYTPGRTPVH